MVHEGPVIAVSFSHDDRYLATGSLDKTAKVWDFKENLELAPIIHDDEVTDVSFGSSGRHLATGSVDKTARVWELTLATEWDPEQVAEETAQQQIQEIVRIPRASPSLRSRRHGKCDNKTHHKLKSYTEDAERLISCRLNYIFQKF